MPRPVFLPSQSWPAVWRGFLGGALLWMAVGARAQSLEQAQKDFLAGNYDAAIKAAQKRVAAGDYQDEWRVLLVKGLLTVGRYDEAHSNAVAAVHNSSANLELRLLARETELYQNDDAAARRDLVEMKYLIERRFRAFEAEDGVPLGHALLLLGVEPRLVLENCYRRAEKADPPLRAAFLATGELALDKHDYKLAGDAFQAGLKKFPKDADLEGGLARAFESGDRKEMLTAARAALKANPRHIPSLLLLADHLIDGEQYDDAKEQLDLVLQVNPHQPQAWAYRAVLAHLRYDNVAEQKARAEALKFWGTNPAVDYLIGQKLAEKYRFEEAAAAQRRALDFEPACLPAERELAQDLLRLGHPDEGWKIALAASAQDKYDVALYNLANLHDQMAKFQTLTNADFTVRMSTNEAALYGDRVLKLLGRARETLCKKYGVELPQRTTVEIFPRQSDFAIATFGMPGGAGYLGVCFGPVITANSPASQLPNPAIWESVLWHEFCHVVTLTETKNRMPRWLSEGISVYEERQADPAWGEKFNLDYRKMILKGELTPLGELSSAFLTPKDGKHLQFAYYESSQVVAYLVEHFGLDALKAVLKDLREGAEINKAIADHTEPLPKLEKQFADFIHDKAVNLAPGVDLETPPAEEADEGPLSTMQKMIHGPKRGSIDPDTSSDPLWRLAHPTNYYVQLERAENLISSNNWTDAKEILEPLARGYHGESGGDNTLWLLALTHRGLKDTNAELATLQQFATQECDFVRLYVRLIDLCGQRQDWPSVMKYAQRLLAINPLLSTPWEAIAQAGTALGQNDAAIEAYRKLLLLDPLDPAEAHYQLARLLHARGDSESDAKRHALQALEEAPRFRDAQRLLLEIERAGRGRASTAPAETHS